MSEAVFFQDREHVIIVWNPITEDHEETDAENFYMVRPYEMYAPLLLIKTVQVNTKICPYYSMKFIMRNGTIYAPLYFHLPNLSQFIDKLKFYMNSYDIAKTLHIQYLSGNESQDMVATMIGSDVIEGLDKLSWNVFAKFSKITKFARDLADCVVQAVDPNTVRPKMQRLSKQRRRSYVPALSGVEEIADMYLLLAEKNEKLQRISTIGELSAEKDLDPSSYEVISTESIFFSRSLRSAQTGINEEQWKKFMDEHGRLTDPAQFKKQVFSMVSRKGNHISMVSSMISL
jgi:hypothetical protein